MDVGTGMSSMISSIGSDQMENGVESNEPSGKMECVHVQRIPTNTKVVLLADVDKDGEMEMIIGLTDRVVRSYRWSASNAEIRTGRLVGLNKWECTDQIGTVTLQVRFFFFFLRYFYRLRDFSLQGNEELKYI